MYSMAAILPGRFIASNSSVLAPPLWNSTRLRRKVLAVNQTMHPDLFPPGFPSQLATAAFLSGEEVAWPLMLATTVVEWLSAHGYAVLGTELWVLRGGAIHALPIGKTGMNEVHGNTVNRKTGELWSSFFTRAATETLAYLQSFNPADIVELGDQYFNLVWADEAEFDKLTTA
jgi:hypothetical protein